MSNISVKVTIESFSKLRVSGFKNFVTRSVFEELQLTQISLNFKTSSCNLKIRSPGEKQKVLKSRKSGVLLFYYFNFDRNYDVLKSKSPWILLNKNININNNEMEMKMENPTHRFRETNLVLQLIWDRKLKVKLWWVGVREKKPKKNGTFFVTFILSKGIFFKICVLSQYIVYWIHFRNIPTFTYQEALLYTLLLLVSKSLKAVNVSSN